MSLAKTPAPPGLTRATHALPPRRDRQANSQQMTAEKLIRYADDFLVLVHGSRAEAEALLGEVAEVLAPIGLRLSEEKTHLTHIDDGFDFLGWGIQRRTWQVRGRDQAHGLHVPIEEATRFDQVKDQAANPPEDSSHARRPSA
jgi:hypothetical protein